MITFSIEPITNYSHTPSWIKSEHYLYCDNFVQDLARISHTSVLSSVRKLLHK